MKLTILGYLGGYPDHGIGTSAYLVQSGDFNLLMDAGSGALLALQKVLDPNLLDAVLLTHYHHDHTADFGVLQYYYQLHSGEKKHLPLPVYGHTKDPLNFAALTFGDFTKGLGYTQDTTLDLGPFKLTFLETEHPVPAFAVRILEKKLPAKCWSILLIRGPLRLGAICQRCRFVISGYEFLGGQAGTALAFNRATSGGIGQGCQRQASGVDPLAARITT